MARGGAKVWYFPDGYLPEKTGPAGTMEAHEALMLMNVSTRPAKVKLDFYFSDREPVTDVPIAIGAERVIGIRLDHPDEIGGLKIPPLTQYAIRVRSNVPIVAMMGRVDTTQTNLAYYSCDGFAERPETESPGLSAVNIRAILKSQYHAALEVLRRAIERCPEDLWTRPRRHARPVWHVAYHTLFFAHLYLQQDEGSFRPWRHSRPEYQFLGPLPWPPHRKPRIGEPYTKREILAYWRLCDAMVDPCADKLDLDVRQCGFWWYRMSTLEHQLVNIRHIQHHAAILSDRVRRATGKGVEWVGGKGKKTSRRGRR